MDAEKLLHDLTGRVREALAQAESQAKEILVDAEQRARELIADAEVEANRIRSGAESEAEQRLAKVRDALAGVEGALGSTEAKAGPTAEVEPQPPPTPEPMPPTIPEPSPPTEPEPQPPAEPEPLPPDPEIVPPAPPQPDRQPPAAEPVAAAVNGDAGERKGDEIGARIVATKMALDGSSREEIAAHLAEHYEVEDAGKLLDFVMARAKK